MRNPKKKQGWEERGIREEVAAPNPEPPLTSPSFNPPCGAHGEKLGKKTLKNTELVARVLVFFFFFGVCRCCCHRWGSRGCHKHKFGVMERGWQPQNPAPLILCSSSIKAIHTHIDCGYSRCAGVKIPTRLFISGVIININIELIYGLIIKMFIKISAALKVKKIHRFQLFTIKTFPLPSLQSWLYSHKSVKFVRP